ncbi:MAG TPA: ABC transporter permease [Spirochaetia bacterium]|nr:ABC transporter permease [Spirochaetia bacterium]
MFLSNLYAELLKLRRSPISWVLPLAFGFGPVVAALFMLILMHPETGQRLGLIAAKAHLAAANADWPTYLSMIGQMMGIGGVVIIGFVGTYIFGREYTEGTAKNLLTLPIRRGRIVAAKFTVCAIWYAAIGIWIYAEAFLLGSLLGMPGYSSALARAALLQGIRLVPETILLVTAPAWIAVASKGFLGPFGFIIATIMLGSALGATGWGPWFPWAIVPLDSGMAGPEAALPGLGAKIVLVCTCGAGWYLTWRTFDRSDNLQ